MRSSPCDLSRRRFLGQACCAAVGSTGILSALGQLRVMGAIAADSLGTPSRAAAVSNDYKALVCLFLQGGSDGTSMLIPTDAASYAAYASTRGDLAIAQSGLLPVAPVRYSDGRSYGIHPEMSGLHSLFGQGKVALLANVGMLVRPTTLLDYKAGKNLPPQLFSHSDQLQQWQSSVPDKPFETGWSGRLADIVDAMNSNNQVSMSISLNGANSSQRGKSITSYAIGTGGAATLPYTMGPSNIPGVFTARSNGIRSLMAAPQANALAAAFGSITADAMADGEYLGNVLRTAPTLRTSFPGSQTAARLAMVAKLISVSQALGLKRQIFFVQLGGWDLHGAQAETWGPLVAELSAAMKSFYDVTVELGVANQVTTFTVSDFGRTLIPNAGGTDYGWGNLQMVMGGAVKAATSTAGCRAWWLTRTTTPAAGAGFPRRVSTNKARRSRPGSASARAISRPCSRTSAASQCRIWVSWRRVSCIGRDAFPG